MTSSQLLLTQFAGKVQYEANRMLDSTYHVDRTFVEHMTIVGLLDVEGCPKAQAPEVVAQVERALRLDVWDKVASIR